VSVGDFKRAFTSPPSPFDKSTGIPYPIKWENITFVFRATDTISTIRFESPYANKTVYGACIDNVRIKKGERCCVLGKTGAL
jgi:hypothetical protein